MLRAALILVVAVAPAWAHGGAFRPPPRKGPRDPVRGPNHPNAPVTPPGGRAPSMTTWEAWWRLNREQYLKIRERMEKREVITGPRTASVDTKRRRLRETILVPEVLAALHHSEFEIRGAAAVAAGKFGLVAAIPRLQAMFKRDKVRDVRESALLGLMLLRDKQLAPFFKRMAVRDKETARFRGFAVLALGFLKESAFLQSVLLNKVKVTGSGREVEEVRATAATALGIAGERSAAIALIKAARSRKVGRKVAGLAASALGPLKDPVTLGDVLQILRDEKLRDEARVGAATAVAALVTPDQKKTIDLLGKVLNRDRHPGVRAMLAISLGKIGGERAEAILVSNLKSCGQRLRAFHYLGLGIAGSKEAGGILLTEFNRIKS
ncbi:MAG: HEAT repeat domain-containing protein, partial [Planctomycetota bacterium]|nr:HEAT repeat domain-containing protein [Planctomycetota bacterium]